MKPIKNRRRQILDDTVQYYKEHPRCIGWKEEEDYRGFTNRYWGQVMYSGESLMVETDGDAVGRLLPKSLRKVIDKVFGEAGISRIWNMLPEDIQELGEEFLIELSCLHDNDKWWFKNDLSEEGKEFYQEIKQKFC